MRLFPAQPARRDRPASSRADLILFASGDLAFNLYWQGLMLFLLFFYTDTVGLPVSTASAIYAAASVWDGIASFAIGIIIDRWRDGPPLRFWLLVGAVPLGLACVATYLPPPLPGVAGIALLFGAHLLFRTGYAALNVPYLAMGARISAASQDRALIAGARMIFGTIAWVAVARGTVPIGTAIAGARHAYVAAAALFAAIATGLFVVVALRYRPTPGLLPRAATPLPEALRSLRENRAATSLLAAMMAMVIAVTVLNKSVLYYFKYFTPDPAAGESALGWMGLAGAAALPLWIGLQRRIGTRLIWFAASGACLAGLLLFEAVPITRAWQMELFLVAMQMAIAGLHFAFWAMLPDTIEYGERVTGVRVEGTTFGLAALLQRVAIGAATLLLGAGFDRAGYLANTVQSAATLAGMRATIVLAPLAFLSLSTLLMLLNPLRRGVHARIVAELATPPAA